MSKTPRVRRTIRHASVLALAAASLAASAGCELNSFLDPSVVGNNRATPTTIPILTRLDVIEEPADTLVPVTPVQATDLEVDTQAYTIGPGDTINVQVYELLQPGGESLQTREVESTGEVRLQQIGTVQASGKTASQLEQDIRQTLAEQDILEDAQVSVIVLESRHKTFSILGQGGIGQLRPGLYVIPKPNFRLLDALALAGGVPGRTKSLLVIRQAELSPGAAGRRPTRNADQPPVTGDAGDLLRNDDLEALDRGLEGDTPPPPSNDSTQNDSRTPAPAGVEGALGGREADQPYVYVPGKGFERAGAVRGPQDGGVEGSAENPTLRDELGRIITQRIIDVPYDRLIEGDLRYNVVIRPGDIIKVPDPSAGFVYVMGFINRPGAYTVPGEKDLTLKQLVASAGGLNGLAVPERTELTRRIGDNYEAIVRVDLKAIFDGTEPDLFLKPNDTIIVGTSFWATPLAVARNGFRVSYGFGFILDRNFNNDVFGDNF